MFHGEKWPWSLEGEPDWYALHDATGVYVADACVEGDKEEWLAVAAALRKGESISFKRLRLRWLSAFEFALDSPRNTQGKPATLSGHAKANELAEIIERTLASGVEP